MRRSLGARSRALSSNRRPSVLLVDDEPAVLLALRRLLFREPYEVLLRRDPREALELVRERPVDLVITDQRMPEMTGIELAKAVRAVSPRSSLVILTAFPDHAVILERTSLRIERLLTKPWDDDELRKTISNVLHRQAKQEGEPPGSAGAPDGPGPGRETEPSFLRIDCRGSTASQVLAAMAPAGAWPKTGGPVLLLENLGLLEDSVSRVVNEIARLAQTKALRVRIDDRSGYVELLLEALEMAASRRATEIH